MHLPHTIWAPHQRVCRFFLPTAITHGGVNIVSNKSVRHYVLRNHVLCYEVVRYSLHDLLRNEFTTVEVRGELDVVEKFIEGE
jgi:hypothetical protein